MGRITIKKALILILIISYCIAPFVSSAPTGKKIQKCYTSFEHDCCSSNNSAPINSCPSDNHTNVCKVTGCCEVDYNTSKEANIPKPNFKITFKIMETLNNRVSAFAQISDIYSFSQNSFLEAQKFLIPSFTTNQLLTVSLLC